MVTTAARQAREPASEDGRLDYVRLPEVGSANLRELKHLNGACFTLIDQANCGSEAVLNLTSFETNRKPKLTHHLNLIR